MASLPSHCVIDQLGHRYAIGARFTHRQQPSPQERTLEVFYVAYEQNVEYSVGEEMAGERRD
jgi:hypothetical protein